MPVIATMQLYATKYMISGAEADPKQCTLAYRWAYLTQDLDQAEVPGLAS
jgi:hypothetical protein